MHNQEFFAEVKNYKDASDQPAHYRDFLAKCFRAYSMRPERCDHFMWITWSPFNATEWSKLDSADKVKLCVRERWQFNFASEQEAAGSTLDSRMIKEVAERIWVLVLSDKQINHLSMSDENLAVIAMHEVLRGEEMTSETEVELEDALQVEDSAESVRRVKDIVSAALLVADPSVRVTRTEYFNHTYVPDLVVEWPSRGVDCLRRVYLRATQDPEQIEIDVKMHESSSSVFVHLRRCCRRRASRSRAWQICRTLLSRRNRW